MKEFRERRDERETLFLLLACGCCCLLLWLKQRIREPQKTATWLPRVYYTPLPFFPLLAQLGILIIIWLYIYIYILYIRESVGQLASGCEERVVEYIE